MREQNPANESPAAALGPLLLGPPQLTLATAESVTCGRIQATIGAVTGASAYFLGGLTAYDPGQKVRLLGLDPALVARDHAVTADVAVAMAQAACRLFESDLAVATTGYAEPQPAHGFVEPGAFWAIARRGGGNTTVVRRGFFAGGARSRMEMQQALADTVLAALVEYLKFFRDAEARSNFA